MRWLFKIIVRLIFALGFLVIVLATVVYWQSNVILHRVYRVAPSAPRLPGDAVSLPRGRHLAQTRGCLPATATTSGAPK